MAETAPGGPGGGSQCGLSPGGQCCARGGGRPTQSLYFLEDRCGLHVSGGGWRLDYDPSQSF